MRRSGRGYARGRIGAQEEERESIPREDKNLIVINDVDGI